MIKRKNYLISYNLMGAIDRAGIRQFFPICFGTGNQSQSMSYGLFIFRVNVVASPLSIITAIPVLPTANARICASRSSAHSDSAGWETSCIKLAKLHKIEWKILFPIPAPILYYQWEKFPILIGSGRIILTLIPNCSSNTIRYQ